MNLTDKVFLSAGFENRKEAREIFQALTSVGADVWFDESNLVPGSAWKDAVTEALVQSSKFVLLVGATPLSYWQRWEIELALSTAAKRKGFQIVPVLLPGGKIENLPSAVQRENAVSISDPGIRDDVAVLVLGKTRQRIPVRKPPRNLPPRQSTFAGREAELQELHDRLSGSGQVGITQQAAVRGHGGIGKTSLAIEYGWRHLADYPGGVFFLTCDSELPPPIAELAPHLGLESAETAEETALRVKAHLERSEPSLLILDNVGGAQQWRSREWSRHLPGEACRRLITTRAESLPGVSMYPLQRLTQDDGMRLLGGYRDDVGENAESVAAVVEWFDGLAVGLTVVGAYMAVQRRLSWQECVDHLISEGLSAVRQTEQVVGDLPDYVARVDAVFDELLDTLPAEQRRALEYAALLPEDQVYAPWIVELLEGDGEVEPPELPGRIGQSAELVVWALVNSQLLRAKGEEERVMGLHPVLRQRVRERLTHVGAIDRLVDRVSELAGRRGEASRTALTEATLRNELPPLVALSRELDALGRSEAAASLASWISSPLRELGQFTAARALLEEFTTTERPEQVEGVATLLSNLAGVLQDLGELVEARRQMERAIEIEERHFDPDHATLATRYSNLAMILKDLGELAEARRRMEQAIEIEERHFDPNHPTLAISYSNLAGILMDLGEQVEARRQIERAIEISERHFDPDHPTLAVSYSNLATILQDLGEPVEARRRIERAIEIQEQHFEPDHPSLAVSYSNLAGILQDLGELSEARRWMERAIEIGERHFGSSHPTLATSYSNLAVILQELGELMEARRRTEQAIGIKEGHFGPDHPSLATSYSNLASILMDLGELVEARRQLERAIAIDERHFDPDHPSLAVSYNNLAQVELAFGNPERACALLLRAKAILDKHFMPSHPHVKLVVAALQRACAEPR